MYYADEVEELREENATLRRQILSLEQDLQETKALLKIAMQCLNGKDNNQGGNN